MATHNCYTMMMIDVTYTKTKPWKGRKKIMCTYHHHTTILPTQNATMNKRKTNYGHLSQNDCHTTMMINFAYTNKIMNKREKIMGTYNCMIIAPWWWPILLMPTQNENRNRRENIYGHLLPSHHDHDRCCLVTNA